jgi:hypothetical protein
MDSIGDDVGLPRGAADQGVALRAELDIPVSCSRASSSCSSQVLETLYAAWGKPARAAAYHTP